MKANVETLKQALQLTAKAHRNAEFMDWSEEGQLGIRDEHCPLVTDVKMICEAFFGTTLMVEVAWGFTNVYFDTYPFLPEVNTNKLDMALPFNWISQIKD